MSQPMHRRTFVQTVAGGAAALALGENQADAQQRGNYFGPLNGFALKDQYGQNFDAKAVLAGQPHLMVFGYEGCPYCEKISPTLAAVQQALNIPAVVVSIHPEADKENAEQYVTSYTDLGIRQYADQGQNPYAEGKGRSVADRKLHLLMAESDDKARELHRAAGKARNDRNPDSHTQLIMLFDGNGREVMYRFGALNPDQTFQRGKLVKDFREKYTELQQARQ